MDNTIGKAELLRRLRQGKAVMDRALAGLSPELLTLPYALGEWSVKDLLAHFTAHEQRALAEIRAAQRGQPLPPPPDYDLNEAAVEASRWQSLDAVRADWERSFQEVVMAVELLPDADFNPGGPLVQALGETIEGALANNTYEHYAEHLDALLALSV